MISITGKTNKSQSGFTYVMALIAVAVVSIGTSVAYISNKHLVRKAEEEEILFQGMAYYRAIQDYYHARTPRSYPRRLEDLVRDPRFLYQRHIRKLYELRNDDMWKTVQNGNGRIIGVYYDSDKKPMRSYGFIDELQLFEQAQTYRDWKFVYVPNAPK